MAQPTIPGLLRAASRAGTLAEQEQLVAEAEERKTAALQKAAAERELDLANAVVRDHLTPARVHEHHTAATDWVGELDTSGGADAEREMIAQGSLWYSKTHEAVKADADEFTEQAAGIARRLAGAFGERAGAAEKAFLQHVGALRGRDVRAGLVVEAASGLPQVGEPGAPVAEATVGPPGASGLPGELTSSNRAPAMQAMEQNTGQYTQQYDGWPSPIDLGQHNVDVSNGDEGQRSNDTEVARTAARKEATMPHTATCPSCRGAGKVPVRRQAASGLPQIQEIVDPNNQPHAENPALTEGSPLANVAFPWEMDAGAQANAIAETEQQLAQREQLKGASRQMRQQVAATAARRAAQQAYMRVMAGQDDSGWAGDMGARGVEPGMQDTGNPGPIDSLPYTDPVYGQGGDQGNRDLKPYGADEADDVTNNPGTWSYGQPTQADVAGRVNMVGQPTASLDPRLARDPEIAKALRFIQARSQLLRRG